MYVTEFIFRRKHLVWLWYCAKNEKSIYLKEEEFIKIKRQLSFHDAVLFAYCFRNYFELNLINAVFKFCQNWVHYYRRYSKAFKMKTETLFNKWTWNWKPNCNRLKCSLKHILQILCIVQLEIKKSKIKIKIQFPTYSGTAYLLHSFS